ncbi:hypothetical protein VTO73DRAFT_11715 [Trametes versicolor]
MAEPTRGNKRPRTDSNATKGDDGPTPIKRDDDFWFEDGNIVLIARNIEFRVYKGILAKHSPVFHDMFSLPSPVAPETFWDTAGTIETCPVVHLSDSPEDFRHVLRVCMPETNLRQVGHPYSSFASDGELSSSMISGALAVARMAHKYQMHDMLALVVKYLKRAFPDKFHEQVAKPLACIPSPYGGSLAVGAVNLARLIDEPLVHEDGSVEHLALEDLGRCLDARGCLTQKILVLATRIFALSVSQECIAAERCREVLEMMLLGVGQDPDMFAEADVISPWMDAYEYSYLPLCCESCQLMLRERDKKERRRTPKVESSFPGKGRVVNASSLLPPAHISTSLRPGTAAATALR